MLVLKGLFKCLVYVMLRSKPAPLCAVSQHSPYRATLYLRHEILLANMCCSFLILSPLKKWSHPYLVLGWFCHPGRRLRAFLSAILLHGLILNYFLAVVKVCGQANNCLLKFQWGTWNEIIIPVSWATWTTLHYLVLLLLSSSLAVPFCFYSCVVYLQIQPSRAK